MNDQCIELNRFAHHRRTINWLLRTSSNNRNNSCASAVIHPCRILHSSSFPSIEHSHVDRDADSNSSMSTRMIVERNEEILSDTMCNSDEMLDEHLHKSVREREGELLPLLLDYLESFHGQFEHVQCEMSQTMDSHSRSNVIEVLPSRSARRWLSRTKTSDNDHRRVLGRERDDGQTILFHSPFALIRCHSLHCSDHHEIFLFALRFIHISKKHF